MLLPRVRRILNQRSSYDQGTAEELAKHITDLLIDDSSTNSAFFHHILQLLDDDMEVEITRVVTDSVDQYLAHISQRQPGFSARRV